MGKLFSAVLVLIVTAPALAQEPQAYPPDYAPPIPPYAEGRAIQSAGSSYCYVGAHPADTHAAPGSMPWHEDMGRHFHFYPPLDLRLFAFRDGCYYFVGDPSDFGYAGQTFSYYGAHPVHASWGGGWCFMIGGHAHSWQPWSQHFTTVGAWYYWQGPYDATFWAYWPYYSHYYRSYYPHYYASGRYHRGHDYRAAPPIHRVPAPAGGWRGGDGHGRDHGGSHAGNHDGNWQRGRGAPEPTQSGGWRGSAPAQVAPAPSAIHGRSTGGWGTPRGATPSAGSWGGGFSGGTRMQAPSAPSTTAAPPSRSSGGGAVMGGGSGGAARGWRR